jgi:nucleotide-binding universal stress UspA family protein
MTRFNSILIPLDGSPEAAKGAGCALWLAQTLGATLHVLHATAQPLPGREALERLRLPDPGRAQVVVHQLAEHAEAAVLETIARHQIDLVVMSARGESASAGLALHQRVGTVAQAVIERSPVPVLLLPARYREALPWTSMLVAASGEHAADRALEAAAHLGAALRLKLTVVHCHDGPPGTGGAYADAPHHEYGRRLQEMLERGLAGCSDEECRCVEEVRLSRGEPGAALLEQASRLGSSVLALGWHGTLAAGRAPVLKRLLEEAECALLLLRSSERSSARLKVGSEMNER